MDENIISLLEELSLRTSISEDEAYRTAASNELSSNYTSSSNISTPNQDQLVGNNLAEEDHELKNAVNSLFHDLAPTNSANQNESINSGYDKSKMLAALLGNIDLVTNAVKKINQSVALGKKMEQIYRSYYVNPNVHLDLNELSQLIRSFSELYDGENYVREVNVSRVYQAYCKKLIDIYNQRSKFMISNDEDAMMS